MVDPMDDELTYGGEGDEDGKDENGVDKCIIDDENDVQGPAAPR